MELQRNTHHVFRIMYHFVWIPKYRHKIFTEPKVSPSDIMQIIKSISAKEFFRCYPEIRKKFFWGGKLWTQSYFVETIGNVNEEVIREYVRNQLQEMDKVEYKAKQLELF